MAKNKKTDAEEAPQLAQVIVLVMIIAALFGMSIAYQLVKIAEISKDVKDGALFLLGSLLILIFEAILVLILIVDEIRRVTNG